MAFTQKEESILKKIVALEQASRALHKKNVEMNNALRAATKTPNDTIRAQFESDTNSLRSIVEQKKTELESEF